MLGIIDYREMRGWRSWFGSPDMMGHPELVKQVEREELGPLISPEGLEHLQSKYVQSVRVSTPYKCILFFTTLIYFSFFTTAKFWCVFW